MEIFLNIALGSLTHLIKRRSIVMSTSIDLVIFQQPSSIAKVKKEKICLQRYDDTLRQVHLINQSKAIFQTWHHFGTTQCIQQNK